ncbi:MAG: redox-regulated ATPase YchF [Candidatus Thermoplasmatota archaeon]|nr:redox-regulated ATPase YchF [Euryarchaeota archaeon]MBU4032079.1 redox-regulated ATPase YchF [Candidatus Thermoplasmatota archaeon]MBU4072137.1 redox-regulated ATPase YchF [Candidatus Thermoplasmatota archaeon]MBU4143470.1 redox-regulated ATPase YchF [Candidatus Thermoplasmatota archaeon]MBU4591439.1 redox-regulated ATPase YchF [Candidatus Thermoplasmatota archaeon]
MDVGIVGKPNVGKSTFYSAATMAPAEIANYPFTTVKANVGIGHVRGKCPHEEFGVLCNPNNAPCENGTRLIPVELIDVAGLVPDAWQGKGLGNKFLDDLRQASALIHIVDASGSTLADGTPCKIGRHNPLEDVAFLENEIDHWFFSLLQKDWHKIVRQMSMDGKKIDRVLQEKFTGLAITEAQISAAMRKANLDPRPDKWSDDELLNLCAEIRRSGKPMLVAANKCDQASDENLEALGKLAVTVIPTSAEYELALKKAAKAGLLDYLPGADSFTLKEPSKLNMAQKKALDKISQFMEKFGGTGVQKCLETAIYDMLDLIPVYPVEDENKLTNKEGLVLPDAHLMPNGSNARELAYRVHTDLGDNFIRAIDARTKRVVGHDHVLKRDDVITIVARR